MIRFWFKSLLVTALVAGAFAALVSNLQVDDVAGARGRGLAAIAAVLRASFVDPLGLPLATGLIATMTLLVCGFFALGRSDRAPSGAADRTRLDNHLAAKFAFPEGPDLVDRYMAMEDFRVANSPPPRSFGRKRAVERHAPGPIDQDPARIALSVISSHSLDSYFTDYGFEGRWREAHAALVAAGEGRLADILSRAGECYERYIEEVFTLAGGEPAAEDDARYAASMQAYGREWRAAT